jgi:hypothetical protein
MIDDNRTPEGRWCWVYACAWGDLVNGEYDIEHTLDQAEELYLAHGHEDPVAFAKKDFDAMLGELESKKAA